MYPTTQSQKSQRYLTAAIKAFEYASTRTPEQIWRQYTTKEVPLNRHQKRDGSWEPMLCWAAAELYNTTGETRYNDYLLEHRKAIRYWGQRDVRYWPYLICEHPGVDRELQEEMLLT